MGNCLGTANIKRILIYGNGIKLRRKLLKTKGRGHA